MKYFDKNTWFWILIGALFFLPFLGGVHLFDWDEINFAELAREMVLRGNWLQMTINFETFTEKPPLFFWFQALSMTIFGIGEYAARFPNALLGIIVLPFLYISGKFMVDRKFGFLWALSWFGSTLPFLYFKSGIIDPYFNFFIFNGLFFLIHFLWKRRDLSFIFLSRSARFYLVVGGIFIGLGILTKGPVAYLIVVLTLLSYALSKSLKFGMSFMDFIIYSLSALGVFLLWFAVEYSFNGPDFIVEFTIRQWELLTTSDAGHKGFPAYHFVVLLLGCFPASIFALRGLGKIKGLHSHVVDFQRWMIILLLVVLVLFSLVGTKIIHYSSMAYYPISFLSALSLWQILEFPRKRQIWIALVVSLIALIAIAISIALPYAGMHIEEIRPLFEKDPFAMANLDAEVPWSYWDYLPAVILTISLIVYWLYRKRSPNFAIRTLFFGNAIWVFAALIFFIGKVERISQRAAVEFFQEYSQEDVYLINYGYKSYVPGFYGEVEPYIDPKAYKKEWLYHGEIDRDVLIATKINRTLELEREIPDAELMYSKNGFYFYRRKAYAK
ncbi:MAG: glycosyltransferase family 39 protein [Bacteroidetes bacterium]|nr:glycosyltransferase family 39 protein [Bacteroidota bacterium]